MADVVVFVDRAVAGGLPGVCVVDGVGTTNRLAVRQEVGGGARLGVAWLLLLAGPVGWVGLLLLAATRSGKGEMLTVQLPYTPAAEARMRAALREGGIGWALVAVAVVVALVALVVDPWAGFAFLAYGAAAAALVVGVAAIVRGAWRLRATRVGVELDASRRWVTLRGVHPRFAAAAMGTAPRATMGE